MQARAIVGVDVNRAEVQAVGIPPPDEGEVLTETLYTCVSPGTDLRVLSNAEHTDHYPYIPSYTNLGRVVERGPGVSLAEGTVVFHTGTQRVEGVNLRWGAQVSHCVLPASQVHPVPEGMDLLDVVLTKLGAIALHGVRHSRPFLGESVAVVGLGVIGQLSARLHQAAGGEVVATDRSAHRVEVARAAGVEAMPLQGTLAETFQPRFPGGCEIVVDATGVPSVLPEALALLKPVPWGNPWRPNPRFVVQGSYAESFTVPYMPAFMPQTTFYLPRDNQPDEYLTVMRLVRQGRLRLRDLVSDVRSPEEAQRTFDELRDPNTRLMTVAFDWSR